MSSHYDVKCVWCLEPDKNVADTCELQKNCILGQGFTYKSQFFKCNAIRREVRKSVIMPLKSFQVSFKAQKNII